MEFPQETQINSYIAADDFNLGARLIDFSLGCGCLLLLGVTLGVAAFVVMVIG